MKPDLRVRAADDPESLLVVVVDIASTSWLKSCGGNATKGSQLLGATLDCLVAFIRAFELLHSENRAIILTVAANGHRVAYPRIPESGLTENSLRGGSGDGEEGGVYDDVSEALQEAVRNPTAGDTGAPRISAACARALCLINRARIGKDKLQARILTLLAASDDPAQYVSSMNCFFSAQRMKVPIDACMVGGDGELESTYFQQAAFLTKGVYFKPQSPDALLQTLLTVFLPDSLSREFLAMPVPEQVDFRASCFDTRKIIDIGDTCSVCLSTFDVSVKKKYPAMCRVCNARFSVTSAKKRAVRK